MSRTVRISCYRCEGPGAAGRFQDYEVPVERETSLQDLLMYIGEHLDPTLAFYKHAACKQGLCRGVQRAPERQGRPGLHRAGGGGFRAPHPGACTAASG